MTNLPLPELPFCQSAEKSQTTPTTPPVATREPLILIFGNDKDVRFLLRTLLEMWNYRVQEATSVEEAIEFAQTEQPALILMDTTISILGNLATMRRMRENSSFGNAPFILLSGHAQPKFRSMALALGAIDFLVKPLDFDSLASAIKRNVKNDNLHEQDTGGFYEFNNYDNQYHQ